MAEISKKTQPWAGTKMSKFLDKHLSSISDTVTLRDVAAALDYNRPNIISMFRSGETKVPLDKIPALAKVIRVDPNFLMRLGLEQWWPGQLPLINKMFERTLATENEMALVDVYRQAVGDRDVRLTPETLQRIGTIIQGEVTRPD